MSEVVDSMRDTRPTTPGTVWDAEMVARVAWACIARPGDAAVGALIVAHGAAAALEVVVATRLVEWEGVRLRPIRTGLLQRYSPRLVARAIDSTVRADLAVLVPGRPGWPTQLEDLGVAAPVALWIRGDTAVLSRPSVAVTGTHDPSPAGIHEVLDVASSLADRGYVVVAGVTPGTDTLALRAALVIDETAVAVIPSGLIQAESTEHAPLLAEVAVRGAMVSERPPLVVSDGVGREARGRLVAAIAGKTVAIDTGTPVQELGVVRSALALGRPLGAISAATPARSQPDGVPGVTWVPSVREVAWL